MHNQCLFLIFDTLKDYYATIYIYRDRNNYYPLNLSLQKIQCKYIYFVISICDYFYYKDNVFYQNKKYYDSYIL